MIPPDTETANVSEHEILFDPIEHTYTVNGKQKISVTTPIGLLKNFDNIDPAVIEKARIRGQAVHAATELWDSNDLGECDPKVLSYLNGWINFVTDTGFIVLLSEEPVYSAIYDYTGTLDRYGLMNSRPVVLDVKATAAVDDFVGWQIAAYAQALKESKPNMDTDKQTQRLCVQLGPKFARGYKLHEYKDPNDFRNFITCLNFYKLRRKYNGAI